MDFRISSFSVRIGVPNRCRARDSVGENYYYSSHHCSLPLAVLSSTPIADFAQLLMIISRVMTLWRRGLNAVGLGKTSASVLRWYHPPGALGESLGTSVNNAQTLVFYTICAKTRGRGKGTELTFDPLGLPSDLTRKQKKFWVEQIHNQNIWNNIHFQLFSHYPLLIVF